MTAVPYKLQNSWEEIFDVPIPWHMVYELTPMQNFTFFNLNYYTKFLQLIECVRYIYIYIYI